MMAAAPCAQISRRLREALFAAVLVHDTIDLDAPPPAVVPLDFEPDQFARFFAAAHAVWVDGVQRGALARIARRSLAGRPLPPGDAALFRDVRARFKQLRFAYAMFDRTHDYPPALHRITRTMGRLQDALRNRSRVRAIVSAAILCLLVRRRPFARMVAAIDRFRPSDRGSFRAFVAREREAIRAALASPQMTAKHFHETRKVVSRLVAMFDCAATLEPTPLHRATVRYLSTINGLMGGMHDEMVARRLDGTQDYHGETFALPEAVAMRLRTLERALAGAG